MSPIHIAGNSTIQPTISMAANCLAIVGYQRMLQGAGGIYFRLVDKM